MLDVFSTNSDPGDWEAAFAGPDSFDHDKVFGVENPITPTDVTVMDVLGFTVAGNGAPPSAKFLITDTSSGTSSAAAGTPYTGPVPSLQNEYLNLTTDNLNITAAAPNVFIHSGSGEDAIAALAGTNVLDGGIGSNFLTGGTGFRHLLRR
jgi:Ca2+-binding RTX toxin-like protein